MREKAPTLLRLSLLVHVVNSSAMSHRKPSPAAQSGRVSVAEVADLPGYLRLKLMQSGFWSFGKSEGRIARRYRLELRLRAVERARAGTRVGQLAVTFGERGDDP
jgi:hypothetical protein